MNITRISLVIVLVLLFTICGWSIISGYIPQPFKSILIAVEILVLFVVGYSIAVSFSIRKFRNMSDEEKIRRIKDPVYLELLPYLREALFPLNFKEQYSVGRGPIVKYARDHFLVELGNDKLDEYYYFKASSKIEVVVGAKGTYESPIFDVSIGTNSRDLGNFKSEVRTELSKWLESKVSNNSPIS